MRTTTSSKLREARRTATLIRFTTPFDESSVQGYVLDVGPQFFLLLLVSDRIWFDGFECFRLVDVRNVQPAPNTDFVETALIRRKESVAKKPPISVTSVGALLVSAGRAFPLIAIHRERKDPEVCQIGAVWGVGRTHVDLLEIDPGAKWDATPTSYRLNEITRVGFGGDYEDALALVGGKAPKSPRPVKQSGKPVARPRRASKPGRKRPN